MKNYFSIILLVLNTTTFAQNSWLPVGNLNRHVYELFNDTASDKLFVGGNFTYFINDTTLGIFSWDGAIGASLDCGSGWDCISPISLNNGADPIFAINRYGNDLYATGDISSTSNIELNGIGRFDGQLWHNIGSGLRGTNGASGRGFGLKVLNNELYVMGVFDSCAGIQANSIAKFNGFNWSTVHDFPPLNANGVNFIYDAELYKGELYVVGNFYDPNNFDGPLWNIIKYNGTEWVPVGNGIKGGVGNLIIYKEDLYVCGTFRNTIEGNPPTNSLARWNGNEWLPIGGDLTYTNNPPILTDMLVYNDRLYISGLFYSLGGIETHGIAFWDGVNWNSFDNTFIDIETIGSMQVFQDTLYIGGNFRAIDGDSSKAFIAKWAGGDTIIESGNTTFINEPKQNNVFTIYPNPTTNELHVSFSKPFTGTLKIFDITGRLIIELRENKATEETIAISAVSNGIYYLNAESDIGNIFTRKIVKQ